MGHLSTQRPFFRKKKISLASFCNGNPNESTHHFSVSWGNHMAGRWPLPNTHLFLQEGVAEVGRALPWASGLSPHSSPSEELGTVRVTLTLDASVYPYVKWRVSPLDLQGPSTLKFYALGFNPLYKLVGGFGQPPVFLQGRRSKNTSTRSQETQKWGAKVREGLQKRKAGRHFFQRMGGSTAGQWWVPQGSRSQNPPQPQGSVHSGPFPMVSNSCPASCIFCAVIRFLLLGFFSKEGWPILSNTFQSQKRQIGEALS